jgi:hypothetical protein
MRLLVVAFVLAASVAVSAETIRILSDATVRARPDARSEALNVFKVGTVLEVAERQGDWYPVLLPPDSRGLRRYGYIAADVAEVLADQPQLAAGAPRIGVTPGTSLAIFVDVAIAEHITDHVSRLNVARNRELGELLAREAGSRVRKRGFRANEPGVTSVGLYFEGSSVLRVMRNAEAARFGGFRWTYNDARWDLDGHEYRVQDSTSDAVGTELDAGGLGAPPFWLHSALVAAPERATVLRDMYRSLDATDRLHPPGMRRARDWQRSLPGTRGLTSPGEAALIVLVRGRDRTNPAAVPRFFRDAFLDSRYEVGGAQASVFLVQTTLGRLVAWDSRIEGTTTAAKLSQVVGELVNGVVDRARSLK